MSARTSLSKGEQLSGLLAETLRFRDSATIVGLSAFGGALLAMVVVFLFVPKRDKYNFPLRTFVLVLLSVMSIAFAALTVFSAHDAADKARKKHELHLQAIARAQLADMVKSSVEAEGFHGVVVIVDSVHPDQPYGHITIGQAKCYVPVHFKHIVTTTVVEWRPALLTAKGGLAAYSVDAFGALASGCHSLG